jgi:hypothetical protein
MLDNFTSPDETNLASTSRSRKQFSQTIFQFDCSIQTPIIHSSPLYLSIISNQRKKSSQSSRLKNHSEKVQNPLKPSSLSLNFQKASFNSAKIETQRALSHFSSTLSTFRPQTSREIEVKGVNMLKVTQKKLVKYQSELKLSNKMKIKSLSKINPFKLNSKPIPIIVKGRCLRKVLIN